MSTRQSRFEAMFREVYEPLQTYARRRTDAATADDVVADALLVLWRRLDDVPDDMVVPWSYGVARRCLANHRRSDQRREALTDRLGAQRVIDESNEPVDEELHAALDQLDSDDRELLRLWAWEALQPREIALVLDISANAASIRLHRAKQRLGDALRRKSHGDGGHVVVGHHPDREGEAS
jgi:RNA polymerase sigma-70 factor (ECF subfamily)